jgi:hypothetical protein
MGLDVWPRRSQHPAFKASLEARINTVTTQRGVPINTLRLKLVIEGLPARLWHLVKGLLR